MSRRQELPAAAAPIRVLATGTSAVSAGGAAMLLPTAPPYLDVESGFTLELHGTDVPPQGTRAVLEGTLSGRSVEVTTWRPDDGTSAWESPDVVGTDMATAQAVLEAVPEEWAMISFGLSMTTTGEHIAILEVDRATTEIRDWCGSQPAGSIHLLEFIRPRP